MSDKCPYFSSFPPVLGFNTFFLDLITLIREASDKRNLENINKDIDDLDKNTIDNWKPIYEEIYLDEDYSSTNAKRILLKIKLMKKFLV